MKRCECGGHYHRHMVVKTKGMEDGFRYRCAQCKKTITVRDGQIVTGGKKGRPPVLDWRHA